ncbi:MAG: methyltransferase domain-containing protein [Candidatus Thorarchaeota archaeon]
MPDCVGVPVPENQDAHTRSIDYDSVSRIYDKVRVGDPEMIHQILQGVSLTKESLVLDVGCGTGNNTLLFMLASNTRPIGLDLSIGMLRRALDKSPAIQLIHAPADRMPLSSNSFDFVYMTEVIHHLTDVVATLKDINRVLKQGGKFCVTTQSHKQIEQRMTSRFFPDTIAIDQARYPDIDVIEGMLLDAGFEEAKSNTYLFSPQRLGPDYLETVERKGFSMLHKISKEAYSIGLQELRAAFERGDELDYSAGYSFVWATN